MADTTVHQCQCSCCQAGQDQPRRPWHAHLNLLMSRLDEQQQRWLAALEPKKLGYGGDTLLAQTTGLHVDTIRRGREELDVGLQGRPGHRVRQPGARRSPREKKSRPSATTSSSSHNQPPPAIR